MTRVFARPGRTAASSAGPSRRPRDHPASAAISMRAGCIRRSPASLSHRWEHRGVEDIGRDQAEELESAGRHRTNEPRPIEPQRLRDEFYYNFRTLILIPLMSVILIGWGVGAALDTDSSVARRLAGVGAAAAGVLFAASLWLYVRPGPLASDRWRRSVGRRRIGFVVRHAWSRVVIGAGVLWLMGRLPG